MAGTYRQKVPISNNVRVCFVYSIEKPGSAFTNQSQEHSLSFPPIFMNSNVTKFCISKTIWLNQSEVVLHLNAIKHRNIGRTRQRMFLRVISK